MEKTFETEVLTRLAVIESKLDGYQNIKEKAEVAYNTSAQNKEDIKEIEALLNTEDPVEDVQEENIEEENP